MARDSFEANSLLSQTDAEKVYSDAPPRRRRNLLVLSLLLNVALLGYVLISHPAVKVRMYPTAFVESQLVEWRGSKPVYSPAQDAIAHVTKVSGTFTTLSKFSGPPSDEVDAAWEGLYHEYMISAVPREQAALLRNQTERVPGEGEARYVVGLDVFHQIHCLDMVRKALTPERYHHALHRPGLPIPEPKAGEPAFDHIDHCINSVRESLMCSADIAPNVFQWGEGEKRNGARLDVEHTCTNFEQLQGWAREWKPVHKLSAEEHTTDDWVYSGVYSG